MKQTLNEYQFTQEFKRIRPNQFSYEGLQALFHWFEEYEDETGEEIEFDVIAICCEWSEYENLKEFQNGKKEVFNQLPDGIRNIILRSKELDGLDQTDLGDENNGSKNVGEEPIPF